MLPIAIELMAGPGTAMMHEICSAPPAQQVYRLKWLREAQQRGAVAFTPG